MGEEDAYFKGGKYNYWLAETRKTTGQGFVIKLDICKRRIGGIQLKNKGKGINNNWASREFRVSGSLDKKNGTWEVLVQGQLNYTVNQPASLVNYTFEEPVEIQFLKFELVSYWGDMGGGLQYFAAIPAKERFLENDIGSKKGKVSFSLECNNKSRVILPFSESYDMARMK